MDSVSKKSYRSRRTHRKSRLGCANCKRRRIKCDEDKPTCTNCRNHEIECSFMVGVPTPPASESPPHRATSSEPSAGSSCRQPRSRRFKAYAYPSGSLKQTFRVSEPSKEVQSMIQSSESQADFLPLESISLADLHLFHNYTISTYDTMTGDDDKNGLWQNHLVQWGMEFPSILHLILALSGLHLAYKYPESRDKYIRQADEHFTFGVRTVTGVLSQLNAENCQKIYMAAVLVCLIYFGRGPRPGEYLIFSDVGAAEWQVLLRGVKTIVETHRARVFSGILKPDEKEVDRVWSDAMQLEYEEHASHIEAFQRLIMREITEEGQLNMYKAAIDDLHEIMREVYQRRSVGDPGVDLMHLLIGWLYRLPGEIVGLLEQKESRALVMLAYWAVMLKFMHGVWFMKGWSEHVLSGISGCLQPEYRSWMEWPFLEKFRFSRELYGREYMNEVMVVWWKD